MVADVEDRRIPPLARELLESLIAHLRDLERRTAELDRRLIEATRDGAACERLTAVPGAGPVIATAMVAAAGNAKKLSSGRHLAAWLGLVPRQRSSGGKERLLGLSKRGDGYLRWQPIPTAPGPWSASAKGGEALVVDPAGLLGRRAFNVVVAAVANKLARILWVLLGVAAYRAAV